MRSTQPVHGAPDPKHFASLSVALCLALAGAGAALIAARAHRGANDTLLPMDGPAQRELRDGWRELGTLAASFPPAVPSLASQPPASPAAPPPPPARSNAAAQQTASDGLGGNAGDSGKGGGGAGGNHPPPRPIEAPSTATTSAEPGAQPPPINSNASGAPLTPAFSLSSQSALCGPNTCNLGQVCCNASCGTCVAPGATCDKARCDNGIQYPASQSCGLATCNDDSVCCNPSCGICTAPDAECSQRACG